MSQRRQENALYRDVRERFRRVESEGWFLPGARTTKYPRSVTGVSLEGGAALTAGQRYREAAVLFLMGCQANSCQLQVLITKRSTEVSSHPGRYTYLFILFFFFNENCFLGEYCLPGGMHDSISDRTLIDTALRETWEEVGISSDSIEVLSSLPPSLSGWLETMAVTVVPAFLRGDIDSLGMRENRQEVEYTMWVPLRHFIVGDYHQEMRGFWRGVPSSSDSFHFPPSADSSGRPQVVWGLTAAICIAVSSIALGELPHYPSYCSAISEIDDTHVHMLELARTSQLYSTLLRSKL